MGMVRFKICCMASVEEARLAIRYGASALGLVSAMPSGPGVIPEERIREIARAVPAGVTTFLLTARTSAADIIAQERTCGAGVLQLVDEVAPEVYGALRDALPGVGIVQVLHVRGEAEEVLARARAAAPHVHALLLDSGNPAARVKELGGTGRVHDWGISRRVVEAVAPVAVYLAGGLHAGNVGEAIRTVRPFGVDVCSGVRTEGRLDEAKLAAFAAAVREASAAL